ncbi:MAG: hypothetical protein A2117_00580 [Candidatus Wildermuthbacteria bacterium GWA2_46_15]|uniref:Prepilin peptidase n=1 Tax=Candidatus Wildermuthbacteria bacterium GWA2_46_15 TaxID=1802443 RepID=A0A1G2QN94_9BACT|nr:MAG: hypothetical protein A2117_00580 [Candidatus Wildermuthbacteria bacterium GWA2_46_15]
MLNLGFSFFFLLLGLVVGSFLNSLIYRLETNQGFVRGRSFCPACRHALAWRDLLPIWSFLFLRGRCRYCQKPISLQYPLVEISTGLIFLLIFNYSAFAQGFGGLHPFGVSQFSNLVYLLTISSFLIIVFVFDLKHYLIPDELVYAGIGAVFFYRLFEILNFGNWNLSFDGLRMVSGVEPFGTWYLALGNSLPLAINLLFSAIGAALFFFLIYFFSGGRAMGFGDVKLAFLMGLVLAFPKIIVALFFAFFSGAIIGTGLMVLKKKNLKSELPFGPFLVSGIFFALFFGERVINYYLSLLI